MNQHVRLSGWRPGWVRGSDQPTGSRCSPRTRERPRTDSGGSTATPRAGLLLGGRLRAAPLLCHRDVLVGLLDRGRSHLTAAEVDAVEVTLAPRQTAPNPRISALCSPSLHYQRNDPHAMHDSRVVQRLLLTLPRRRRPGSATTSLAASSAFAGCSVTGGCRRQSADTRPSSRGSLPATESNRRTAPRADLIRVARPKRSPRRNNSRR